MVNEEKIDTLTISDVKKKFEEMVKNILFTIQISGDFFNWNEEIKTATLEKIRGLKTNKELTKVFAEIQKSSNFFLTKNSIIPEPTIADSKKTLVLIVGGVAEFVSWYRSWLEANYPGWLDSDQPEKFLIKHIEEKPLATKEENKENSKVKTKGTHQHNYDIRLQAKKQNITSSLIPEQKLKTGEDVMELFTADSLQKILSYVDSSRGALTEYREELVVLADEMKNNKLENQNLMKTLVFNMNDGLEANLRFQKHQLDQQRMELVSLAK